MKIENNTISFQITEKQANRIKLALDAADIDADAEFDRWINSLSELALRKISGEKIDSFFDSVKDNLKDTLSLDAQTKSRITKWATSKKGVNYKVIRSYFQSEKNHNGYANKDEMEQYYNDDISNVAPFLGNFRMLCCDSAFSGQIFIYNKTTKEVLLNEKYKDLVTFYRNDFLK